MQSIIIVDSHNLFRESLCGYLRYADPGLRVEGAADLQGLFDMLRTDGAADLVLIDAGLPGWSGNVNDLAQNEGLSKLGLLIPLLQTEIATDEGIKGVFPKSLSCKAFLNGISDILEGQTFFPSLREHANALDPAAGGSKRLQDFQLTGREKEVLSYLVKGASNKDIARALDLQVVTVKLHVRGICRKMKVSNRTQAALMAKENGWG